MMLFFFFNTHQKRFLCCMLIVRLIIKYMYNICLSNNKNCRLLLLFLFSLSCLLRFLCLLIEVAVNKYWTNVFSLILIFSLSHTHILCFVCAHRNMFFKNYVHKNNVVSFLFFFPFTLVSRIREKKRVSQNIVFCFIDIV